jgi:hypothetical protein
MIAGQKARGGSKDAAIRRRMRKTPAGTQREAKLRIRAHVGSREWIADRMIKTIKKAKWQGVRLSVTDEARRLLRHPACQLSLDEIKDEILLLAVSERMPMELDSIAVQEYARPS